jgi:hypothetical protein
MPIMHNINLYIAQILKDLLAVIVILMSKNIYIFENNIVTLSLIYGLIAHAHLRC